MRLVFRAVALAFVAVAVGCSGFTSVLTPVGKTTAMPAGSVTPSPKPAPTATVAPGAGATPNAAQVNASLQGVQTLYNSFPHSTVSADLATLAGKMVASGSFSAATVTPGGITAQLPGGSRVLVFADHLGDIHVLRDRLGRIDARIGQQPVQQHL